MARQGAGGAEELICTLVSEDRVITRPSWQRVPTIAPHNMLIPHLVVSVFVCVAGTLSLIYLLSTNQTIDGVDLRG